MTPEESQPRGSESNGTQGSDTSSSGERSPVQKGEEYRFASNVPDEQTVPEQEYADYVFNYDQDDATSGNIPDVLLDVPVVKVDELNFELDDLKARVSLFAKVLDLVELSVGVDASLGRVKLDIKGVEAQALLKVRLDNVTAILDRVMTTIDRNPQIIEKLAEGVSSAVQGVGQGAGQAAESVGEGAGSAVEDVGEEAGQAVGEMGQSAGQAVQDVGQGAGQAAQQAGQGAGRAAEQAGQAAGQAAEQTGQVAQQAGQATQDASQVAGQASQATQGVADNVGQSAQQGGDAEEKAGQLAEGTPEEVEATDAARRKAEELGVDLTKVEGTGADGRVLTGDVEEAAD